MEGSMSTMREDLAAGARHGLADRLSRMGPALREGGVADVFYVAGHRVVLGEGFVTCECPANREHCDHVLRAIAHRNEVTRCR